MQCSPVKVPDIKGKIILKPKGNTTYVLYQYGSEYKKEKKHAIPKRTVIGKLTEDNHSFMYPNDKFQEYFPNADVPELLPEKYRSSALRLGAYVVIRKVFEEYKLDALLKNRFGKDTGLLMDLVSYLIVEEDNAGQYYPNYAFCHPLFTSDMRIYSDSKVCRFFQEVTKDQALGFLDDWNRHRDHRQRIYVSYDSTNKNCQAGDIDMIEFGKPKTDMGTPVFNLSVAFDKTNRVPLFYEAYGGSITDISQLKCMVDKVNEYGYRKVGFVLDRGYFSKSNIRYMESNGYSFVIMVKGKKKLVSSLIEEHRGSFETDRDCSIRAYRVYGKTICSRLYEDDNEDRMFHLYFNPAKQAQERETIERTIDKYKLFLDKHIGQDVTLSKAYEEYFNLTYDKKHTLVSYEEKKDEIRHQLELCGYFCIITSERMTAAQALIHYKGRDVSEKLFASDKSFIGSKSMRVQSEESFEAKLFVEFIALIVRNRIYNLLKEMMLRLETRQNYMTVPAAIRELEKIELVRRNEGRYQLDHAVSKRQRIILSSFGMNDEDISRTALEVANTLAKTNYTFVKDEVSTEDDEEEDDGEDAFDIFD